MDELEALRQVRTTLAREENPDRLALRTNWRSGPPPRPRRSFKVPMVSMLATAAVVAGTVTAISLTSDEDQPVRLGENGSPHAPGNALLVAATNVQKGPTGKYWHTTRIAGTIYAVGKSAADHYKVESRMQYDEWTDRNGGSCFAPQDLPARPWTALDKQKWQKAGAPTVVQVPTAEGLAGLFFKPTKTGQSCRKIGDRQFLGMTPKQVAALPTQPKQLENALLNLKGDWEAYAPKVTRQPMRALRGDKRVRALSDVAGTLLASAPAPPAVRAAAFRMLATLPGVKVEGKATDPLGRPGTVISLPVETTIPLGLYTAPKQLGTYRRQWIINPDNGTLLAMRDLVATPPHGSRQLPPGDDGKPRRLTVESQPDRFHKPGEVSEYEVYEVAEWTDAAPN
jgi:hypothetical protein